MAEASPPEGALTAGSFASLLLGYTSQLACGRLDIVVRDEVTSLWLDGGRVFAVVGERDEDKLGTWLVQRGLLQEYEMAAALQDRPRGIRFGSHLVQRGLIEFETLQVELLSLAIAIVARLLFAAGTHRFVEGARFPEDEASLQASTATLLVSAVRVLDELAPLKALVDDEAFLGGAEDAFLMFQKVSLSAPEGYLLSRIDGSLTVKDLKRIMPLPQEQFVRALGALVIAGLVRVREKPGSAKPAPVYEAKAAKPAKRESLQFSREQQREYEDIVKLAAEIRGQSHYQRLRVNPGAALDEVHARFQDLAELYHPDRANEEHLRALGRELAEVFSCLQEAYDVISHPENRRRYDRDEPPPVAERIEDEEAGPKFQDAREELVAANVRRARELISLGDIGQAIQLLDQAVRLRPDPEALLLLARQELHNPMWAQRALDRLKLAVAINPKFTQGWLELARFWRSRHDPGRQRMCVERILKYDSKHVEAQEILKSLRSG
jgi:tetratricopeptide (TPR) repeat protein